MPRAGKSQILVWLSEQAFFRPPPPSTNCTTHTILSMREQKEADYHFVCAARSRVNVCRAFEGCLIPAFTLDTKKVSVNAVYELFLWGSFQESALGCPLTLYSTLVLNVCSAFRGCDMTVFPAALLDLKSLTTL